MIIELALEILPYDFLVGGGAGVTQSSGMLGNNISKCSMR